MRKIETVVYEYTEEDVKLLNTPLPKNPCDTCSRAAQACQGCPLVRDFAEAVKPYQDADVYDIALTLQKMREYESEMRGLLGEYTRMRESLPVIEGFQLPPDLSIDMEF